MFNHIDILEGKVKDSNINKWKGLINEVFKSIRDGFKEYFKRNSFCEIARVPNIVSITGACENLNTLLEVTTIDRNINKLSQTGQISLELALVSNAMIWCLANSFRKETTQDERHLIEFNLMEFEGNFNFNALLNHMRDSYKTSLESLIKYLPKEIISSLKIDTDFIERQIQSDIPAMTYSECIKNIGIEWGEDLSSRQEQQILSHYTGGRIPILITHFPKHIKFFNMAHDEENPSLALSVDLILPHSGEASGGAQRETDYDRLEKSLFSSTMLKMHIDKGGGHSDFNKYLKLIKSGELQLHSGCGFGMERIIQSVLSSDDIRMCSIEYLTNLCLKPEPDENNL